MTASCTELKLFSRKGRCFVMDDMDEQPRHSVSGLMVYQRGTLRK